MTARLHLWVLLLGLAAAVGPARADAPAAAGDEFFEKEVRPLLVERCLKCHGGEKTRGGLKLTSRDGDPPGRRHRPGRRARQAGRQPAHQGRPLRRHDADAQGQASCRPRHRRPDALGGNRPALPRRRRRTPAASTSPTSSGVSGRSSRSRSSPPPAVKDTAWPRSDLDRYILAALEAKGLKPAKPADKRTLIRRATFDLTGLPPTPEEIDAFLKDESPDAFAKVVDRLLASPAYGERWGRHWLDLARYTDSFDARASPPATRWTAATPGATATGSSTPSTATCPTTSSSATSSPATCSRQGRRLQPQGIIATGFLAIGNWGGGDADKDKLLTDIADDQVDVTSRTFLGLTVACARCHDHKFDPIAQADYYGLAGIFFSTHILPNVGPKTNGPPMLRIPLASPAELAKQAERQQRIAELEKQLQGDARSGVSGLCEVAIVRDGEVPDGRVGLPARGRRTPLPCPSPSSPPGKGCTPSPCGSGSTTSAAATTSC